MTMTRIMEPTETTGEAPSHSPPDVRFAPGLSLSHALGWFSIGLGLAEIFAPDEVAKITGVRHRGLLQVYGFRELICGIGILRSRRPTPWMWARVAGDVCDLATLGEAAAYGSHSDALQAELAMIAVGGVAALDVINATQLSLAASLEG